MPSVILRGFFWLVVIVVAASSAAQDVAPFGTEFRVNETTTGDQRFPRVSAGATGDFVVVWQLSASAGPAFGQRYTSFGVPAGGEFPAPAGAHAHPAVATSPSGDFVVVFEDYPPADGSSSGVIGQRYSSTGTPSGATFVVNTYTTNIQEFHAVAADGAGNFVVVWSSSLQDGSAGGIFGQRYASDGSALGGEFRVNTVTTGSQYETAVAASPNGDFVVAWITFANGVYAQRYSSTGAPLGGEFTVDGLGSQPAIAFDAQGAFVIAFASIAEGNSYGVFARRYASTGSSLGSAFRVNSYITGLQAGPSVAADQVGNFVVVWTSAGADGSGYGVRGQRYAGTGAPVGSEFLVSSYTTNWQTNPSISAMPFGNYIVVWESKTQDDSGFGVYAQLFCAPGPAVTAPAPASVAQSVCE